MKNRFEHQHQTWTPSYPNGQEPEVPVIAPPKSNWERYIDGEWNPLRKQPEPAKDKDPSVKCNY